MNIYIQDEVIGFNGDRSTGNRLFIWETFHYLNSLNDFRFELKLLETDYEWVKSGLVNLPNTSTYKRFEVPSDVFELNPTKNKTDETMVDELLPYFHDGKKLPLKDIFINIFGFGPYKIFQDRDEDHIHPLIKDIEFNKELFKKTGEIAKNILTTIHVRRGSGCIHPQKYLDEVMSEKSKRLFVNKKDLKISLKDATLANIIPAKKMVLDAAEKGEPLECHQVYQSPLHPFYEDEVYFKIFDDLIKSPILQGSKICIVHDTFDEDYEHWFEKYPKNLVTSRQLFSKESFSDPILKNQQDDILRTFIDLLILMQTKFCLIPNSSTFSGFASNWKYHENKNYYKTLDMETYLKSIMEKQK